MRTNHLSRDFVSRAKQNTQFFDETDAVYRQDVPQVSNPHGLDLGRRSQDDSQPYPNTMAQHHDYTAPRSRREWGGFRCVN